MTALLSKSDEGVLTSSGTRKALARSLVRKTVLMKYFAHTPPKIAWLQGPQQNKYPPVIRQEASGPQGLRGAAGGIHAKDQTDSAPV